MLLLSLKAWIESEKSSTATLNVFVLFVNMAVTIINLSASLVKEVDENLVISIIYLCIMFVIFATVGLFSRNCTKNMKKYGFLSNVIQDCLNNKDRDKQ